MPTGMRSRRSDRARSVPSSCSVFSAGHRPFAAFQRRGQRGDALFEHRERIAVAFGAGELIDLGRQRVQVVAEPGQRVVGGDVGDDGAKCGDGAFELLHGARDRRWCAGSDRAWRRDCGSPRRSRPIARPASASAALRGFRSSARSMPASAWPSMPLCRVSSIRRDSERISFSINSIARRGIASVMA